MANLKFTFTLLIAIVFAAKVTAQKITISGYVTDAETGEQLIGAVVFDKFSQSGTSTNNYGFYSITINADSAMLTASYVGFKPTEKTVSKTSSVNFELSTYTDLKEVEVKANRQAIQRESQMSTVVIPVTQIKSIPALLGEVDVIKIIQLLPGVQKGTEGSSGIYVRGGGPDQNLILLDGVPVYNVNHLFGFFSVFNGDAINNVQLIKGGFPAYYGGRLSSVIDISMKEGNLNNYNIEGGIGLLASRLTVEGPLKKNKGSFIVSGRRTYLDLLMRPIVKRLTDGQADLGYYFYDLNAKLNWKFSDKDRLYASIYTGQDVFKGITKDSYEDAESKSNSGLNFGLNWGNVTTAIRWNHVVSPKIFHNLLATYSRYRFNINASFYSKYIDKQDATQNSNFETGINYTSGIDDVALRSDFDFTPNAKHYIKYGVNVIYHIFSPGATAYSSKINNISPFDTSIGNKKIQAGEFAAYIQDDWEILPRWKANFGLHLSAFTVQKKFYGSIQPRFSTRVLIIPQLSVKGSFCMMTQYLHLLTNSGVGLPTDLWLPVTARIKPQQAYQGAIGLAYTLKEQYEFSVEGYYKRMWNVSDYKNGANFINSADDWENKLTQGRGWSYGTEFLIQKKEGKLTGWIGYTLNWTQRQFADRNYGRPFYYKYDRRHDLSLVIIYDINKNWRVSGTFIYATGNALTLPTEKYATLVDAYYPTTFFGSVVQNFDKVSNFRVPDYHRLDLGINYSPDLDFKGLKLDFNLSIYNVYSRLNPFFAYLGQSEKDQNKTVLKKVSLFPIIPLLTINFKWGIESKPRKPKQAPVENSNTNEN